MGVIAVVAYPEIQRYEPPMDYSNLAPEKKIKEQSRNKAAAPSAQGQSRALESAGTGYGQEEYSPSYRVQFEPEKRALESILIKYEWHKTLCNMNIISCGRTYEHSYNRLWGNDGYAPPPPCRR
jgi:hypothetical protein